MNRDKIAKGLENLRKAYGQLGYINFTPVPNTTFDEDKKLVFLEIDVDEGKQFFVRRIEFAGNTTTRDKVIRREIALEEGQVYDSHLWEVSLLRLNQLGYFEQLKPDDPNVTERHLNEKDATVDLTLKLKEKGKNQIGLTGGVSGLSGSFIGLSYSTNNFLGLGETLTVQANIGNRQRDLMFGFTEPYLHDRPLQLGFTVYTRKFNFDQAQQAEIFSGQRLNLPSPFLQNLQNYTQASTGFSVSLSYPLHRSFKRVGLTYAYDRSSVIAVSDASKILFTNLAFRGISGPNSLSGIITSKLLPSFSFNTVDSPYFPKTGTSLYLGGEVAGLGGTVRSVRPIIQYKHFIPLQNRRNTIGFNLQASFLTGYGGLVAPPFERFYMGGDNDLRGFDIRSISPVAFLPDKSVISLRNPDGSIVPKDPSNPLRGAYSIPLPLQRIVFPGGDTSVVTNLEYRITIAGTGCACSVYGSGHQSHSQKFTIAHQLGSIERYQQYGVWMSRAGCCLELSGWAISNFFRVPEARQQHKLDSTDVYGTGIASLYAGDQCSVPALLGIQSAPAGYHHLGRRAHYARHVSARGRGRLYFPECGCGIFSQILVARTAQDVPVLCGNHILEGGPKARVLSRSLTMGQRCSYNGSHLPPQFAR